MPDYIIQWLVQNNERACKLRIRLRMLLPIPVAFTAMGLLIFLRFKSPIIGMVLVFTALNCLYYILAKIAESKGRLAAGIEIMAAYAQVQDEMLARIIPPELREGVDEHT